MLEMCYCWDIISLHFLKAPVAQLDRATVYGTVGWRFESSRVYFLFLSFMNMIANDPQHFMRYALREAETAFEKGEIPVGCVIVHKGEIIAKAHNQREMLQDPTAHAEMIALTAASEHIGSWRLHDCDMYVTLEPCSMCAGALVLARLTKLFYGASDPKAGACGTLYNIQDDPRLNHRVETHSGILEYECSTILTDFFKQRRTKANGEKR